MIDFFLFLCNKSKFCSDVCKYTTNPDHAKNPESVRIAEEFLKCFEGSGTFTDLHFLEKDS